MNKIQKIIVSVLVMAMLAFSTGALIATVAAAPSSYSGLPWASNQLVSPGTLTVVGSSTVGPIATEEIGEGNFVNYFNGLITAGTISSSPITAVNLQTQGSGTAIPALAETTGTADVGEMSRPPSSGTTGEFETASMTNMQQYCVGVDSVAIVVDPTMTWFPTTLTTAQVAQLFADNNPTQAANVNTGQTPGANQGIQGNTGSTGYYTTWGQFLDAYYGGAANVPSTVPTAVLTENINRAVRDPTSGTYDCFNNYFGAPNGYTFEHKTGGIADGALDMAPYTYCQENINVYNTVKAGNPTNGDYIGFISLGYLQTYGDNGANMIGLNIAYNMAAAPQGNTTSPVIHYYGTTNTWHSSEALLTTNLGSIRYSNTSQRHLLLLWNQRLSSYRSIRGMEMAMGSCSRLIPASGPTLTAGVWIAYMMADGTTNAATSQLQAV